MGVACDGYLPLTTFSSELITNPVEKRSYFYFHQETRPQLRSFSEHNFWDQLILQGGHCEPALRQILVAIGAFHEYMETEDPGDRDLRQQIAETTHRRAITTVVTELPRISIANVLMASILLAFLDNLKGNMGNAHKHITGAAAIVQEHRSGGAGRRSLLVSKVLAPIIDDLKTVLYSAFAPSPILLVGTVNDAPFIDFLDAHDQLYATTEDIQLQLKASRTSDFALLHQLEFWYQRFSAFLEPGSSCSCSWPECHSHHALGALFLETIFLLARARLHCSLAGQDVTLDLFEDDFHRVLDACEQMVQILLSSTTDLSTSARVCLGFRPSYFMSCWMVIEACRDPILRRRSISILRLRHEANAFWDTFCVADTAVGFVEYEETHSPIQPVLCSADIPEAARAHLLIVSGFRVDPKSGSISLISNYPRSDLLKVVVVRNSNSHITSPEEEPRVVLDAFWMARTLAGSYVTIPNQEVPGGMPTNTPTAIGGLFPQASSGTSCAESASTKLWSMLDETRTSQDHLNEWRCKIAHPPWDSVQRVRKPDVAVDTGLTGTNGGEETSRLEERTMGVQLRTIHV